MNNRLLAAAITGRELDAVAAGGKKTKQNKQNYKNLRIIRTSENHRKTEGQREKQSRSSVVLSHLAADQVIRNLATQKRLEYKV